MEFVKPVLLVLVGAFAAGAFFVSGLDHHLPRWARFWQEEPIRVAIVPSGTAEGCPPSYAIDNRTDQPVFLTLTDSSNTYLPPDSYRQPQNRNFDRDRDYPRGAAFDGADLTGGLGALNNPESSEPGVAPTEDNDPGDSNLGGSSAEFGDADSGYGRNPYSDDRNREPDDYTYENRGRDVPGPQSRNYPAPAGSYTPPPAPGGPLPLTPPENSSPFGAPTTPGYGPPQPGYGSSDYPAPPAAAYGAAAAKVRPGEIYFASSPNGFGRCEGNGNTVTLQFTE